MAARAEDCRTSSLCRRSGACSLRRGRCVVGSDADCQQAEVCQQRGICFARSGGCSSTCGPEDHGASVAQRRAAVFTFFGKWRAVDDDEVSRFWKCLVRARHRDVRLARDPGELVVGLEAAFKRSPGKQPGHLRACLPRLAAARKKLLAICPPAGLPRALAAFREALQQAHKATRAYAKRLDRRSAVASADQKVLAQGAAFHWALQKKRYADGLAHWNLLRCVVPDLDKQVRKVKRPPDTQYVVEYIYHRCGKSGVAPGPMARKLRGCMSRPLVVKDARDPAFRRGLKMLSGDSRELMAIKHCFKTINRDVVARDAAPPTGGLRQVPRGAATDPGRGTKNQGGARPVTGV